MFSTFLAAEKSDKLSCQNACHWGFVDTAVLVRVQEDSLILEKSAG